MKRVSPVGALARGLVAGALGAAAQNLFFKATSKIAPKPPKDAFEPPEREQRDEAETETVARRWVEQLMARPLGEEQKKLGGQIVHHAFGAAWGGLYGLARESYRPIATPFGALGFGAAVWMASDNLILPAFRIAAWPQRYPLKSHAYALAAHFVYGLAVYAAYDATRPAAAAIVGAAVTSRVLSRRIGRYLPKAARPAAAAALGAAVRARAKHPVRRVVEAAWGL